MTMKELMNITALVVRGCWENVFDVLVKIKIQLLLTSPTSSDRVLFKKSQISNVVLQNKTVAVLFIVFEDNGLAY